MAEKFVARRGGIRGKLHIGIEDENGERSLVCGSKSSVHVHINETIFDLKRENITCKKCLERY